jgi:hypothetical protein
MGRGTCGTSLRYVCHRYVAAARVDFCGAVTLLCRQCYSVCWAVLGILFATNACAGERVAHTRRPNSNVGACIRVLGAGLGAGVSLYRRVRFSACLSRWQPCAVAWFVPVCANVPASGVFRVYPIPYRPTVYLFFIDHCSWRRDVTGV